MKKSESNLSFTRYSHIDHHSNIAFKISSDLNRARSEEVAVSLRKKVENLKKSLEDASRESNDTISKLKREVESATGQLMDKTKGKGFNSVVVVIVIFIVFVVVGIVFVVFELS